MADFCKPCSIYMFGEDFGDIRAEPGTLLTALCEGCGYVTVDDTGNIIKGDTNERTQSTTKTKEGQDT